MRIPGIAVVFVFLFSLNSSPFGAATVEESSPLVRVGIYQNPPKLFKDSMFVPQGIFVDILERIAQEEKWNLQYIPCLFARCLEMVEQGEIDLLPDVAPTPERHKLFDFHEYPVLGSWSQIYAAPNLKLHSLADLKGEKIALLRGSVQEKHFRILMEGLGYPIKVVYADSFAEAFALVQKHKAKALVANHFVGNKLAASHGLRTTPLVFQPTNLYFVAPKGKHKNLLDAIDKHLAAWNLQPHSPYFRSLSKWTSDSQSKAIPKHLLWVIGAILLLLFCSLFMLYWLRRMVNLRTRQLAHSEKLARESFQELELLLNTMPDALLLVNHTRCIGKVNNSFCNLFGYEKSEALGKEHALLLASLPNTQPREGSPDTALFGAKVPLDILYTRKNGSTFLGETVQAGLPLVQEQCTGTLFLIRDVSTQRRLEDELQHLQKVESVERMAGAIAHDFNNYLSLILGNTEIISMQEVPEFIRQNVEEIQNAAKKSRDVVRQLLSFSHKSRLEIRPINLNTMVEGSLELLQRMVEPVATLYWKESVNSLNVLADSTQLDRILTNLCVNARDAIKEKGIIELGTDLLTQLPTNLSLYPTQTTGVFVELWIRDNGVGMDEKTRTSVFEPFFSTKMTGTGLGLAIVHQVMRNHQGGIQIQSTPGCGTIFRLFFPQYLGTL